MEDTELIDKYLQEKLTEQEKADFEQRLKKDIPFMEEFKVAKAIQTGIKEHYQAEILAGFKELENKITEKESKTPQLIFVKTRWLIAASIVFILGVIILVWQLSKPSLSEHYKAYYQKYPNYVADIARGETNHDSYNNAFHKYEQGAYQDAISLFQEVAGKYPDKKTEIQLYWGLSYLETGNTDKAIEKLEEASKNTSNRFSEVTQWYLMLAYLKNKDIDKTKMLLQKIINNKGDYSSEAQSLRDIL